MSSESLGGEGASAPSPDAAREHPTAVVADAPTAAVDPHPTRVEPADRPTHVQQDERPTQVDQDEHDTLATTHSTPVVDRRAAEVLRLHEDVQERDHGAAPTIVIEDDVIPKRVRRPFDLVRLLSAVVAIVVIVAVSFFLTAATVGLQDDFNDAGRQLPGVVRLLVGLVSGVGVLGLPIAITVNLLMRRRPRQLLDAVLGLLLAGTLAIAISILIQEYGSEQLLVALTGQTSRDDRLALYAVVAGLTAFVTVARVVGENRLGALSIVVIAAVALTRTASGDDSLVTSGLSILFGWAIGLILRYLLGTPTTRPSGREVASTLEGAGWPLSVLRASRETRRGRTYLATTTSGHVLRLTVLDRDREGAGLLRYAWRALRLREPTGTGFSMRSALNQFALMSYAAQAGGGSTPRLRLVSAVGPDSALLAYDHVDGRTFDQTPPDEITDQDLERAFRAVRDLHTDRIAHRSLSGEELIKGTDGQVWLTGLADGVVAASDVQIRIDIAELTATLGLIAGAERTLAAGRKVLGPETFSRGLPALQPVAMSPATRRSLRGHKKLLKSLREGMLTLQPEGGEPEQLDLRRIKPRTIITLVLGTFAAYVLIGQLTSYNLLTLFSNADWWWVLAAAVLSFLSFIGASLSLSGFVPERLNHIRTFAAQLAAGFATLVSPPTVGTVAVNVRYLQKSGIHPALATASVGVSQVFAFFSHILLLLGFGILAGQTAHFDFEPPRWAIIAVGVIIVLAAASFAFGPVRRLATERIQPILKEIGPRLVTLAQRPWKIAEGVGGILLLNAAFCACMIACVMTFGGHGNLAAIAIVYLAGSTLGQAAPTPGGIGAVEAVYVAGLTAAGVDPGIALSATFLFRLLTFYIPTVPGYFSFNWLQKVGSL